MRGLAALRHRNFRYFYTALVITSLGSTLVRTTLLFHVYQLTGSPLHLGFVGLASGVPTIVLALLGGVIADRTDRQRLLVVTQVVFGVLGLAAAALAAAGAIDVWHLYAVALASAGLTAINAPARTA